MLSEGNVIRTPGSNALTGVFHITPTTLDSGLRKLADSQPEQTPDKGVGALKRKRFWADIGGTIMTPEEVFARFRLRFADITPLLDLRAEPGTPAILSKYLGRYDSPQYPNGIFVTLDGNQLVIDPRGGGKIPLYAQSDTTFSMEGNIVEFLFRPRAFQEVASA